MLGLTLVRSTLHKGLRSLAGSILVIMFLASCVSNKKYVYLQKDDLKVPLDYNKPVRTYQTMETSYLLQPNDLISVRFESLTPDEFDFLSNGKEGQQQTNLTPNNALILGELIDKEGYIKFPVIGKFHAAGLSIFQAQDSLQKVAEIFLDSPIVRVRLLNFRFTVLGEVTKEGTIVLNNNNVTILEALGWAGGLGELADKSKIKLLRQNNGITEVHYVNLLDESFINSPIYFCHQNDILIVPPLRQRPFRKYFGQNFALVASAVSILLLSINLSK